MKKIEEKAKQSIRLEYKLTMNLIQDIFKHRISKFYFLLYQNLIPYSQTYFITY